MNKIISVVKNVLPLAALALALVLIFTPIPVMIIQALIALNFVFAVCLFSAGLFKKTRRTDLFPNLVLFFLHVHLLHRRGDHKNVFDNQNIGGANSCSSNHRPIGLSRKLRLRILFHFIYVRCDNFVL